MTERSKRGWFQIHLSTAIILMFACAALMYANMNAPKQFGGGGDSAGMAVFIHKDSGWPSIECSLTMCHSCASP